MTARHYSNSQNLIISFEYSWFLAKNLSSFVSLPWKLHNRKCHNVHWTNLKAMIWIFQICLSAVLALAHCEPFLTSGPAAGPVHAAVGGLVATKRGYRVSFTNLFMCYHFFSSKTIWLIKKNQFLLPQLFFYFVCNSID